MKFAEGRAVVGMFFHNKLSYRKGVEYLVDWSRANNLYINVGKTKEMVVDFKKRGYTPISSLSVQGL